MKTRRTYRIQYKNILLGVLCLVVLTAFFCGQTYAKQKNIPILQENKIKAGYLLRLASYIRWPEDKNEEVLICLIGSDSFGEFIDKMVFAKPRTRDNKPIHIDRRPVGKKMMIAT